MLLSGRRRATLSSAMTLTHERLLDLVHYDPETGVFTWATPRPKIRVGERVGNLRDDEYLGVKLLGKSYLLHRVAFFYMTGRWPVGDLDHRNRKRADNRWDNLREATRGQNRTNTTTVRSKAGFRGVYELKPRADGRCRFKAQIMVQGVLTHLGVFDTPEQAHAAYVRAAQAAHGEFAEHLNQSPAPGASPAS